MGQCPVYIPSADEYHTSLTPLKNEELTKFKLSHSASQNTLETCTISNSSSSYDDDSDISQNIRYKETIKKFNKQLKQNKEQTSHKLVVDLSNLNNTNSNTKILYQDDECVVEVVNDDTNSSVAKQSTAGTDVTYDNSIATLKISNMRFPSNNNANSNVPPTLEEKNKFDSSDGNKCEGYEHHPSFYLYKAIPDDLIEDNILHITIKANLYDFYQNKYLQMFPNTSSSSSNSKTINKNITSSSPERSVYRNGNTFMGLSIKGALNIFNLMKQNKKKSRSAFQQNLKKSNIIISTQSQDDEDANKDKPIALCNVVSIRDTTIIVRIYSISKPRFEGQHSASIPTNDDKSYYPWADLHINGEFPLPIKYSIYFHNHNGCISLYNMKKRSSQFKGSHVDIGSLTIQVLEHTIVDNANQFKSTSSSDYYNLCCLVSLLQDTNENVSVANDTHFCMSMSKHVDPILIICFTSIIDEVLESMMKCQYNLMLRQKKNKLSR